MSTVFRGVGSQIARSKGLAPVLDAAAKEIEAYMIFIAADHIDTGDYIDSIEVTVDKSSPSGQDRYVGPTDEASIAIEFGYVDKAGKVHDGQHIVEKTYNSIPRA